MRKLTHNLLAKIIAVFLITITFFGTIFMAGSVVLVYATGGYEGTAEYAKADVAESLLYNYAGDIGNVYRAGLDPFERYENANFWFEVYSEDGKLIGSNYDGGEYFTVVKAPVVYSFTEKIDSDGSVHLEEEYVSVMLYAKQTPTRTDHLSNAYWLINTAFNLQWLFILLTAVGIILFFALATFLMCSAGRYAGEDKPRLSNFDKFPFDILTVGYLVVFMAEYVVLDALYHRSIIFLVAFGVFFFVDFLLLLLYAYTLAARIKTGTLFTGTVIYKMVVGLYRIIKRLFQRCIYILRRIPLIWKTVLIVSIVFVMEYLCIILFQFDTFMQIFTWFVSRCFIIPAVLLIAIGFKRLQAGSQKIANGNIDYKINTDNMLFDFKALGENLNNINSGMKKAVDEQMKSERFKTELITNVSHDIKTPLTSIINYVDLIKKEDCDNEKIKEYTEVLDRQSSRLKKLVDDLVEASKASSGVLAVDMKPCEIGVLLSQTAGEYEEKLKKAGLELVLTQPETSVTIMADGRHLWRIFDNLMNNVCKYSLPSSRVYLTLEEQNGNAVVTFKNISKTPLNITSDELMERFVRGDSSRNTEGSGLGLSITKSLTELQKGKFDLTVDGDLFKATLTFKI